MEPVEKMKEQSVTCRVTCSNICLPKAEGLRCTTMALALQNKKTRERNNGIKT